MGYWEERNGNKKANNKKREREKQKGTGISRAFDTSSPAHKHMHTLSPTQGTGS